MNAENEINYYVKKKKSLLRRFDAALNIIKQILIDNFGEAKFNEIFTRTRKDFEELLPQIPYVGGKDNNMTEYLIDSALLLPLLRYFEKEGLSFNEIGKLAYEIYEAFYSVIPATDDIFSDAIIEREKKLAIKSKLRKYPGDWVFDFVESDGKTFVYGMDFYECGVNKFYKNQNAEHLMPLICLADYAQARAYGHGVKRTQTRGNGAKICDFRYVKGTIPPRGWPPDHLKEFKKK